MVRDTTLVLTSCDRADLLQITLQSLCDNTNFTGIDKIVIIEDSHNTEIPEKIVPKEIQGVPVICLQNDENRGLQYSIERAYGEVETPYIYHCEDDWIFSTSLFLEESRLILERFHDVSMVMVRDVTTFNAKFTSGKLEAVEMPNGEQVEFWRTPHDVNSDFGHYSFNPGLRRTEDLITLAERRNMLNVITSERKMSMGFRDHMKMRLALLKRGDVRHIGDGRSMVKVFYEKKNRKN